MLSSAMSAWCLGAVCAGGEGQKDQQAEVAVGLEQAQAEGRVLVVQAGNLPDKMRCYEWQAGIEHPAGAGEVGGGEQGDGGDGVAGGNGAAAGLFPEQGAGAEGEQGVVFFVLHGVDGVVADDPGDAGGVEKQSRAGEGAGDGAPAGEGTPGEGDAEEQLGQRSDALGKGVDADQRHDGEAQGNGEIVELQQYGEGGEQLQGEKDQCGAGGEDSGGQGAVAGAVHLPVNVAVEEIVPAASSAAHEQGAEGEEQQQPEMVQSGGWSRGRGEGEN